MMHTNPEAAEVDQALTNVAVEPLALPIEIAAHVAGVTRTRMFAAVANNELTARKPGKATIIELPELRRWIRSLPARGKNPEATAAA